MPDRTPRQLIADLLRQGPHSAADLARRLGMPMKRVISDLEHVRRSVRERERWAVRAAECLSCGFVFRERERIDAPSRCPECRSRDIRDARFEIQVT
ncbi:MAG: transcriptional regulator [Planctomycetes bacterium]|nr:transcriptional regulator [Planctomycetota bacterium]